VRPGGQWSAGAKGGEEIVELLAAVEPHEIGMMRLFAAVEEAHLSAAGGHGVRRLEGVVAGDDCYYSRCGREGVVRAGGAKCRRSYEEETRIEEFERHRDSPLMGRVHFRGKPDRRRGSNDLSSAILRCVLRRRSDPTPCHPAVAQRLSVRS